MAQKRDHYEVLGINKDASLADITKAYQSKAMACHPDSPILKKKSAAEQAEAANLFLLVKEAGEVLKDAKKRAVYDQHGHEGIDGLKTGKMTTSSVMVPVTSREAPEDFFAKRMAEKMGTSFSSTPVTTSQDNSGASSDHAERLKQRQALRKQRQGADTSFEEDVVHTVTDVFREVAEGVDSATNFFRGKAEDIIISTHVLEKFRDNLRDLLNEVDRAVEHAAKHNTQNPKP